MKLSVVIPVYNEQDTIVHIVERVLATDLRDISMNENKDMSEPGCEIIIVDDASVDDTHDRLNEFRMGVRDNHL